MSISISKSNANFKKQLKNFVPFEPLHLCTFKPKSIYLQNGISNWRNRFSWCAFITSFN